MKSLLSVIASCLAAAVATAAEPGLDSPQAIGPFLDGAFPTTTPGPTGSWAVADAFPNLTFVDPVRMVKDPLSAGHAYIVCRNGEIWRIPFDASATNAQKVRVLDRRANTWGFWDAGMMSLSFHPEFGQPGSPNRGYVYVFYQYIPQPNGNTSPSLPSYMRLSRFTVPDGQAVFDPASEYVLINQYDRHNWHSGGQTFFGPEGFLHLVVGDEGAANDSFNSTQKIHDRLFGGILRIDVDRDPSRSHPIRRQPRQISMPPGWEPSYTQGYYIPDDNPFPDPDGGVLEEFWAIGTRSPHSMHFDRQTGDIWIADVGQGTREEISIATRGGNLQWPYREGFATGPKAKPANLIGHDIEPVFDYPRNMGGCVIGGIVYRGSTHLGSLGGKYIFGDHNTRALYALTHIPGQPATVQYLTSVNRSGGTKRGLAGICEGPDGEVYFMELGNTGTNTGKILRLVRNGTPVPDPPPWLSQTGAFTDTAALTPRPGLIPYDLNSPLWTDGALKRRWVAIPNNGTHNSAEERVTYRETGAWAFPVGTVLVKHFALPVDERDPSVVRPVETRFFIHGTDGAYYGVTYRWNEEGTDAWLLDGGDSRDFTITAADSSTRVQRWDFPSRVDCRTCHTMEADNVLGLRSHQMNGKAFYPVTGRTANQLETWNHLGIFGNSFGSRDPDQLPRSVDPRDPHAALDHRVRSYLDANCASCHHPDGVTANFDASFHTPLASQGLVGGEVNRPFGGGGERVIKPGDPALSLLHHRASVVGGGQMPPLGRNLIDVEGIALIEDWILSLDETSFGFAGADAAPVAGPDQATGVHGSAVPIDPLANDSDANAPPGIHGVAIVTPPQHGTVRVSGAEKRLIYTHDGSSARLDSFVYTLTDPQGLVSQPATVTIGIPYDFAAWVAETPGATGDPAADGDGDLLPELLEFALGGGPMDGASPGSGAVVIDADGEDIVIVARRPDGLSGIRYELETGSDLVGWWPADPPVIESAGDGTETLRWSGAGGWPSVSPSAGFARLRVSLDGSPHSAATLPLGWLKAGFAGSRTFGVPFRDPVFASKVAGSDGLRLSVIGDPPLPAGFRGYVEVIDGPFAGHRFELAGSSPGFLDLAEDGPRTMPPPDLTGARVVVCAHHTLGDWFPKDRFIGSTNPAAADQVQIHRNDGTAPGRFELYYLLDARPDPSVHEWRAFLPGQGDQGGRVIRPGQGVFVRRPAGASPASVIFTGQVRANPFALPQFAGMNLVSPPFPLTLTPRQFGLLDPQAGFAASTNLNAADQFHLFRGSRFHIHYLLDHPTLPAFWREAVPASPDANDLPLFAPDDGVFIRRAAPESVPLIPPPWNP